MKKILAIDDQKDNLTIYEAVISSRLGNHKVLTALSGKEGIKIAREQQPDAILLDILMPEMDGYETCKILKEDKLTKHIPIIMITALESDTASRTKGLNMGADTFLSKPIDAVEFTAQLNVVLRIKTAEDKLRAEKEELDIAVKQRTEQLRKSEESYRLLVENQTDLLVKVDTEGHFLYVSPSYCKIFGKTEKELLKHKFMPLVHKDDRESTEKAMLELFVPPHKCYIEQRVKTIDGWRWYGWTDTAILNDNGEVIEIIGLGRDIHDRKLAEQELMESEEKNRLIVENSPYCIHQLDTNSKIISMNLAGLEMVGVKKEDEINGTPYLDFVSVKDKGRIDKLLKMALSGEKSIFEYRASNNQIYASSFMPIIKDGEVTRIMGLTQDITSSKMEAMKQTAELRLLDYASSHNIREFIQKLLDEVEILTGSKVGFFHFVDDDQVELSIQAWSTNTLESWCKLKVEDGDSEITKSGVWADCLRERKAVIHNDYQKLPNKKRLPEGHPQIIRELLVPIIRDGKVLAVIGIGNKNTDYNQQDIEMVQSLADTAWETVVRKKTEEALKESEEKFRMMILNSPDLTLIQNPDGEVLYVSPQANEVLGHKGDIFLNTKFPEFIHPDDKEMAFGMMKKALKGENISNFEYRFLGENGEVNWLSQTARAIKTQGKITSIQSNVANINKHKEAEENILKNQHYLSKAQEIGSIGTWELDVKKNILRWTDENYKIFGVPLGTELNYEIFLNCVHPDDRDYVNEKWTTALRNEDYDIEHRLLVDDKVKWVREKADIEFDTMGIAIKAIGVTQDITATKLIEKELENSRNQYHQLFDLLPYGGEVINTKGIIVNCSTSSSLMLGYEEHEIIGQHISKFLSVDSIELFKEKFPILISGKPMSTDITMICKDGTELQILRAAQPIFGDDGSVESVLALNVDVTDRRKADEVIKESEERLKIIFDSAPDAYYLSDLKGEFLDGNAAAAEVLGYKKEELIGKSFLKLKLLSAKELPKAAKALAKSVMGKKTGPDEFLLKRKDGSKVAVEISTYPVKIKGKTVILGIARDITDRIKAEEALKESEEKYRNLVERANDGICILQDGVVKFANSSLLDLYGGKLSEIIGTPFAGFVHPDELEKLRKYYELRFKGVDVPSIYETILRHNKGHKVYVEVSAGIINYLGKPADLVIIRDITERRESEESLLKLSAAVDQSPSVIVITGLDGKIEYVNPKFTETTGYSLNESIGQLPRLLKSGNQSNEIYQELWQTISSGKVWHGEFHNKKKNGELFWEAASVSPIFDKSGEITNYIKVAEDISERKLVEVELKGSEQRFRSLMQQAPFVVELYDLAGLQISVNKAYEELWGFPAERTLNKFNVLKSKEVEDTGLMEFVKRAYNGESVVVPEYSFDPSGDTEAKGAGRTRWLSTRIYPINDVSDKIKNIVIVHQDITDHKRAEQIEKVVYNISNAVITTDNLENLISIIQSELGTIIDTTNFYVALYDKETNRFSFPFYADEKDSYFSANAENTLTKYVIDTKKSLLANLDTKKKFVKEGKLKHQGSLSKIWLGVPLIIEGEVTGAFAVQSYKDENAFTESDLEVLEFVAHQISISINRKKTEDDLIKALEKAEESDRLKSAFLANMSHEIRTPMNGILGFASLLKLPNLSGDQLKKYVGIIDNSGKRMLNIINDLIDISKIEAGQMEIKISECNINEQVEYLFTFFRPDAVKVKLDLSYNNSILTKDALVKTDREKLYAILTNLLKNALKYTHEGSIKFGYEQKGEMLEFYVKDTGIGIPADRLDAIFERFIQADIEDRRAYEGAGLGLSITEAYVKMLGGKIWVDSVEGQGSQFYFTIPFNEDNRMEIKTEEENEKKLTATSQKLKILIAEDEEVAMEYLKIILRKSSKEILQAKSGKEVVKLCRSNPDLDLVLMDIKMPGMDGYEATREIRKFNKDIVIIAQTAYALAGDREKALEAGCNDYVSKPVNQNRLLEIIGKLIPG